MQGRPFLALCEESLQKRLLRCQRRGRAGSLRPPAAGFAAAGGRARGAQRIPEGEIRRVRLAGGKNPRFAQFPARVSAGNRLRFGRPRIVFGDITADQGRGCPVARPDSDADPSVPRSRRWRGTSAARKNGH